MRPSRHRIRRVAVKTLMLADGLRIRPIGLQRERRRRAGADNGVLSHQGRLAPRVFGYVGWGIRRSINGGRNEQDRSRSRMGSILSQVFDIKTMRSRSTLVKWLVAEVAAAPAIAAPGIAANRCRRALVRNNLHNVQETTISHPTSPGRALWGAGVPAASRHSRSMQAKFTPRAKAEAASPTSLPSMPRAAQRCGPLPPETTATAPVT